MRWAQSSDRGAPARMQRYTVREVVGGGEQRRRAPRWRPGRRSPHRRSSTPMGVGGHADAAQRLPKQEQPVGLDRDRARPAPCPGSRRAWRVPAQMTISSGEVRTPRTRPRYSVSASRNSMRPSGSPMRNASVGAVARARLVEASQAARGNCETSGEPGIRLCGGTPGLPRGRAGSGAVADVDHPGARALPGGQPALGDQFGVGLGHGVAGQSEVGGQAARRRQHRPRVPAGRTGWPRAGRRPGVPARRAAPGVMTSRRSRCRSRDPELAHEVTA